MMMQRAYALAVALVAGALAAGCTTTTVTTSGGEVLSASRAAQSTRPSEASGAARARSRADLAAGYYRNGQLAIALEEAQRATAMDPNFGEAYGLLGLIYMDMGIGAPPRRTSSARSSSKRRIRS
jgi:Tfp pilus assembly protein PilF